MSVHGAWRGVAGFAGGAKEVKNFFKMCQKKMIAQGVSPADAAHLLSTITGALVVANALRDTAQYDRATRELLRHRKH